MNNLDKLLSIASSSLSECEPELSGPIRNMAGTSTEQLFEILRQRNGFYAFEGALHVFQAIPVKVKWAYLIGITLTCGAVATKA